MEVEDFLAGNCDEGEVELLRVGEDGVADCEPRGAVGEEIVMS